MSLSKISSASEELRKLEELQASVNLQIEEVRQLISQRGGSASSSKGLGQWHAEKTEGREAPEAFLEDLQGSGIISQGTIQRLRETFGSARSAASWLRQECGDLSNVRPVDFLRGEGDEAEVLRVLDCIDHGAFA